MKKKRLLLSGSTILAMFMSSTLPVEANSNFPQPSFPKISHRVTITYWTWQVNADRIVKAFEHAYPNITVKLENVGQQSTEYSKLETAIKAGTGAPDVVMLEYEVLPQFEQTGGLLDISKYDGSMKSYFLPWTWNQVSVGSKLYAIPQDVEPMVLDYRASEMTKYKLSIPKTWAQFATDAESYHKATGKPFSVFGTNDSNFITSLLWQNGVNPISGNGNNWIINFNTPQAQKVLTYWGKLIKSGAIKAEPTLTPTYISELAKGDFPVLVGAPWYSLMFDSVIPNQKGQWRVSLPPQWNANGPASDGNYGGSSNAVTTQSKNSQAAALFASWYTASETGMNDALKPFNKGGMGSIWGTKYLTKSPNFNVSDPYFGGQKVYHQYESAGKEVNTSFEWSPWTTFISNAMTVEMSKAAANKESFDQALANIQSSVVNFAESEGYNVTK